MILNDPQWSSMIFNDPTLPYTILHYPTRSSMILNGPRWSSMVLNGPQWSSMVLNGPQWSSMILRTLSYVINMEIFHIVLFFDSLFWFLCWNHVFSTGRWMTNVALNFECLFWYFFYQPILKSDLTSVQFTRNYLFWVILPWSCTEFQNSAAVKKR